MVAGDDHLTGYVPVRLLRLKVKTRRFLDRATSCVGQYYAFAVLTRTMHSNILALVLNCCSKHLMGAGVAHTNVGVDLPFLPYC